MKIIAVTDRSVVEDLNDLLSEVVSYSSSHPGSELFWLCHLDDSSFYAIAKECPTKEQVEFYMSGHGWEEQVISLVLENMETSLSLEK